MQKKAIIRISGIVQGVGFRPFVYRTAVNAGLKGYVKNLGDAGVEVYLEATPEDLARFMEILRRRKPANARIDEMSLAYVTSGPKTSGFEIIESGGYGIGGSVTPDYGICADCTLEVLGENNRRRSYPLTTCTSCGPRYTVLKSMPLDRKHTSYSRYRLCKECKQEYTDHKDRRFHAQTIACGKCGPKYSLYDAKGKKIKNPVESTIRFLKEEKIVAIKGVGGFHLACLASSEAAVTEMRKRLCRFGQPFAVMAPAGKVRGFADVSEQEEKLLVGRERPILLLKKKDNALPEIVSPSLHNVGVMLPYTALHYLLFKDIDDALVMTSANSHGEPMAIGAGELGNSSYADYCLTHDLEIVNRCDDSVMKKVNEKPVFIRRSRGYAPLPIPIKNPSNKTVLALGAEESLTFCLFKGRNAYPSQHIGNTGRPRTQEYMEEAVERFLKIFQAKPEIVACDMHPSFFTTKYAQKLSRKHNAELMQVQHHHAHLYSLAGEHNLDELVGICCDGTGYGLDGNTWGGEIFTLKENDVERAGHLKEQPMPGGDLATTYPSRMVAGILQDALPEDELTTVLESLTFKHGSKEIPVVLKQLRQGINVQKTTSCGRVLDSISVLLGLCSYREYEAEPAMKLESAGTKGKEIDCPDLASENGIDTTKLLLWAVERKKEDRIEDIAHTSQKKIGEALAQLAVKAAGKKDINTIGFTGGVAVNAIIAKEIADHIKDNGFAYVQNRKVPPGDGGISYGQATYAIKKQI